VDGRVVGQAFSRRTADMAPGLFFLSGDVDRDAWGRGVGSALADAVEAHALSHGATKLTAFCPEREPTGIRFCERRGYSLGRTFFASVLHLDEFDRSAFPAGLPHGLRLTTLTELGDTEENRRRLYDVNRECDEDEPGSLEFGLYAWEDYVRNTLTAPWFTPDGAFIALDGDEWAGIHVLGPWDMGGPNDMSTDFTGVRRPWRGRGLALALKLAGIDWARSLGRRRLLTQNDSTNAGMLAINDRLGFRREPGMHAMNKETRPK
jgi:mycothiol synthase